MLPYLIITLLLTSTLSAIYDPSTEPRRSDAQPGIVSSSDENLSRQISDLLNSPGFSQRFGSVKFSIADGVITLKGSVSSIHDKMEVEKALRSIKGIKSVRSQLLIRGKEAALNEIAHGGHSHAPVAKNVPLPRDISTSNADKQLNAQIRIDAQDLWKKYPNVRLNTSDGVVTLEGSVTSNEDPDKLVTAIQRMDKVKSVNNELIFKKQP